MVSLVSTFALLRLNDPPYALPCTCSYPSLACGVYAMLPAKLGEDDAAGTHVPLCASRLETTLLTREILLEGLVGSGTVLAWGEEAGV